MALFRQLCKLDNEKPWIPIGKTLVPLKELNRLFFGVLPFLYGSQNSFIDKAKEELIDELFDEFSRLHGLLLWLAWKCEADFRKPKKEKLGYWPEEERQKNIERAQLLLVTPEAACDPLAFEEARKSVRQTTMNKKKSETWLSVHRYWGKKFARLRENIPKKMHKLKTYPKAGDIGIYKKSIKPHLSIVIRTGEFIALANFERANSIVEYLPSFVGTIDFPASLDEN